MSCMIVRVSLPLALSMLSASGTSAGPVLYDLGADWSETANPNGVWSLREGASALPHIDWWQRILGGWTAAQPGWARSEDANNRLPFWMKSNGTETFVHDWIAGDIVVHSTDASNGVGQGIANAVWTSPCHGVATIEGHVWLGRDIGRSNNWRLVHNSTVLTGGSLVSGDAFSRGNPFPFSAGTGGAAVLQSRRVAAGDELRLEVERTSSAGEFVGVVYRVTFIAGQTCEGDADASLTVDFGDITVVLTNWGATSGGCPDGAFQGDANADGIVSFADITIVLTRWLSNCSL